MAKITYTHDDPDKPDIDSFDAEHIQVRMAARGYSPRRADAPRPNRFTESIFDEPPTDIGDESPEPKE